MRMETHTKAYVCQEPEAAAGLLANRYRMALSDVETYTKKKRLLVIDCKALAAIDMAEEGADLKAGEIEEVERQRSARK